MSSHGEGQELFCFGLGYSALTLARRLQGQGWRVGGTVRDPAKRERLAAEGIEVWPFPLPDPVAALAGFSQVLVSVPPGGESRGTSDEPAGGDPVLAHHGAALASLAPGLRWLGYLSTTGVYGDTGGAWVDESTPPRPSGPRQQARVAAEAGWLAWGEQTGVPVHLFRLAGIYGPGRSALDSVRAGQARRIDKPGQLFSRIHVEDIAQVVAASIARPRAGAIYNLCDDEPAPGHEVVAYACRLLGVEPPPLVPFEQAALSPMAASFYADNRRVRNQLIKDELGVRLHYPTYRAGLEAQLRQQVR